MSLLVWLHIQFGCVFPALQEIVTDARKNWIFVREFADLLAFTVEASRVLNSSIVSADGGFGYVGR